MRIGITLKIDVSKIDKSRLFRGEKGTYLDLTTFVDTEEKDKYGNNGFITQSTTKEEREAGAKMPIVGNVRVFYAEKSAPEKSVQDKSEKSEKSEKSVSEDFNDDIPF